MLTCRLKSVWFSNLNHRLFTIIEWLSGNVPDSFLQIWSQLRMFRRYHCLQKLCAYPGRKQGSLLHWQFIMCIIHCENSSDIVEIQLRNPSSVFSWSLTRTTCSIWGEIMRKLMLQWGISPWRTVSSFKLLVWSFLLTNYRVRIANWSSITYPPPSPSSWIILCGLQSI